jgi:hypothetical protein
MVSRRTLSARGAEFEAWLMPMGHMLRYQVGEACFCELVTDRDHGLPTQGVVTTFPAQGEKDYEQGFEDAAVLYTASVQSENLSDAVYSSNLREMKELARETKAMIHEWTLTDPLTGQSLGKCLSTLEINRFDDEIHCSSTHMHPVGGLVVRTQTVFQRV